MGLFDLFDSTPKSPTAATTQPKNRVLVVEDELDIREFYQELLTDEGYEVITAVNGEDGLNKALKSNPQLVILDINMPIMDGMTMLKKFRAYQQFQNTPVIVLTNSGNIENFHRATVDNRATAFLIKVNVEPEKVISMVRDIMYGTM
jgi:two-component system response regulator (stage 0 sporulation protein F)